MTADPSISEVPEQRHLASADAAIVPWRRLDRRMIFVDAVQALVSLVPVAVAVVVFDVSLGDGGLWPVLAIAVSGVGASVADAYRWAVTFYRITGEVVEGRSGLFMRTFRSMRRDRIRTVDVHATLRHRLGGLRVVTIGAGQQSAAGDVALELDAISLADARILQDLLLHRAPERAAVGAGERVLDTSTPAEVSDGSADAVVLARFRPAWIVYNAFSIWAYVMAGGLLWGAYWVLPMFGIGTQELVGEVVGWGQLGIAGSVAVGVAAATVIGVVGMAVNFVFEYWGFVLARVPADDGDTVLRTRHGLFTTREVDRDDGRMRGIEISEPLWWRWIGAADTTVITTGLDMSAMSQPAAVLPRTPIGTARTVASQVLGLTPDPLDAPLQPHPRTALRRRLWWAAATSTVVTLVMVWLVATGGLPPPALVGAVTVWPAALVAARIAYRSLGYAIAGDHLVVRSGLNARTTVALQRSAVTTIAVRESVLQRRLGLRTVTAMTAAGHAAYDAPDLGRDDAVAFADAAAPGILTSFVTAEQG